MAASLTQQKPVSNQVLQNYILDAMSSYSVMATGLLVRFCQQASSMSSEEGACLSSSQQTPTSNTNNMNLIWLINWREEISDGSVQRVNRHTDQSRFSEIDMWFGLLSLNISESSQPSHSQIKSVHATTEAKIKVPTSKCAAKYMHDQTTSDRPSSWEISTDIRQTFTCSVTIRSSKAKIYQKNFV